MNEQKQFNLKEQAPLLIGVSVGAAIAGTNFMTLDGIALFAIKAVIVFCGLVIAESLMMKVLPKTK